MAATYSGNPEDSLNDKIRFLIGDTDMDDAILSDEEIASLLIMESNNVFGTASLACSVISAKYSKLVDRTLGKEISENLSDLSEQYERKSEHFAKLKNNKQSYTPFMNQDVAEKTYAFTIGMMRNDEDN